MYYESWYHVVSCLSEWIQKWNWFQQRSEFVFLYLNIPDTSTTVICSPEMVPPSCPLMQYMANEGTVYWRSHSNTAVPALQLNYIAELQNLNTVAAWERRRVCCGDNIEKINCRLPGIVNEVFGRPAPPAPSQSLVFVGCRCGTVGRLPSQKVRVWSWALNANVCLGWQLHSW